MNAFGSLRKYLLHFSYMGSEFRGMQKQKPQLVNGNMIWLNTVQYNLENAIKYVFKPRHDVRTHTSSRTDSGVHALHSTVDVHLQRERDVHPDLLTAELNKYFVANDITIRIIKSEVIPEWFSAQKHAISRKYLYRLAIRKQPAERSSPIQSRYLNEYPFSEHNRVFPVQCSDINIELMKEAAGMLEGTHDFFSFMSRSSKKAHDLKTIRTLYSIKMSPGQPFMPLFDPNTDLFNYWDIIFHGRSFLYKQVRRTVGVLLAVGQGVMTMDDVRRLINEPGPASWNPRAICVPPYALYLLEVNYNPLDFRVQQKGRNINNEPVTYALVNSFDDD